ncbi:MAG: hypothetical protein ABL880_07300 [Methylotenera sp.]
MISFIKKHDSVIAQLLTFFGLLLVVYQLYEGNENGRWENYNAMNLRYYSWYSNMPENVETDTCVPFSEQSNEVKKWARSYFNLYSEEYWLYKEGLIPEEMWTKRIENGVYVNLKTYPLLVRGYYYWKAKHAFNHPEDFRVLVDAKLEKLKPELKLLECKPSSPNSKPK